ncbi:hypothetical protein DSO57_1002708, partial [Entomophthora muscae]
MIIPIFKFVVFTLPPVLLFIWFTSPNLWEQIFSSVPPLGNNLSHLLYLVEDLPGRVQDLLISGKRLMKSLTCNDLDPLLLELFPGPLAKRTP